MRRGGSVVRGELPARGVRVGLGRRQQRDDCLSDALLVQRDVLTHGAINACTATRVNWDTATFPQRPEWQVGAGLWRGMEHRYGRLGNAHVSSLPPPSPQRNAGETIRRYETNMLQLPVEVHPPHHLGSAYNPKSTPAPLERPGA